MYKSFTLQAYIFPTTPDKGKQGILTKWNEKTRVAMVYFIDDNSCLISNDRRWSEDK